MACSDSHKRVILAGMRRGNEACIGFELQWNGSFYTDSVKLDIMSQYTGVLQLCSDSNMSNGRVTERSCTFGDMETATISFNQVSLIFTSVEGQEPKTANN